MIAISTFFPKNFKGIIGVCGASPIPKDVYEIAVELGRLISEHNYAVACGGLYGTMEAVCKGAKSASNGGFTIGILPSFHKDSSNKYVDLKIPTGLGEARNLVLVSTADAIITISGSAGTLSEIAFAWKLGKPICALKPTGGWSEKLAGKKIDDRRSDEIFSAESPQEAIKYVVSRIDDK